MIVVIWDFGATLIWGTAGPSKVRFDFVLSGGVGALGLLCCAIAGIIAGAAALRSFAVGRRRAGTVLGGVFTITFVGWSLAVRYWPPVAVIGLSLGCLALWWAARAPTNDPPATAEGHRREPGAHGAWLRVLPPVVLPCLSGFAFYSYLRWGSKSWADPGCGANLIVPAFIAAIAVSGLGVWGSTRAAGKRSEAIAAAVVITALVAAAMCAVAFLIWFTQNNCGD
ncbi:MAG: hypothetical protein ACRDL8_12460 [Solirubrobacteraceae bacterium]